MNGDSITSGRHVIEVIWQRFLRYRPYKKTIRQYETAVKAAKEAEQLKDRVKAVRITLDGKVVWANGRKKRQS